MTRPDGVQAENRPGAGSSARNIAACCGGRGISQPRACLRRRRRPESADRKTGRTVLLNARITQRAHDRFHEIVEAEQARYEAGEIMHRPTLGEIVERALQALEREMKGQGA